MLGLGIPELILVFVIALVIFGPKKLPEIGKAFGKGLSEFRKATSEIKSETEIISETEIKTEEAEPSKSV